MKIIHMLDDHADVWLRIPEDTIRSCDDPAEHYRVWALYGDDVLIYEPKEEAPLTIHAISGISYTVQPGFIAELQPTLTFEVAGVEVEMPSVWLANGPIRPSISDPGFALYFDDKTAWVLEIMYLILQQRILTPGTPVLASGTPAKLIVS